MRCFKINVKSLSISNRKGINDDSIALYSGDYFFIDSQKYYAYNTVNSYSELYLLKKIFYKKTYLKKDSNGEIVDDYTWTWLNNINIINPQIVYGYAKYYLTDKSIDNLIEQEVLIDCTVEGNREYNIKTILSEV
jgi:hypothetical protein